jgi:transcriptional regulator with XRE-family HTH domain
MRADAGVSMRALARAAGISSSTLSEIESCDTDPGIEALARIAVALGGELTVRIDHGTGPLVRDHIQAAMVQALLGSLDPRWHAGLEVAVYRPVYGVIDVVLDERHAASRPDPTVGLAVVAGEAHSQVRRAEQQLRWANAKADALAIARGAASLAAPVTRLLLLRSTRANRAVVATYADLFGTTHPARCADAFDALTGTAPWPGSAIVWCLVGKTSAELLREPPPGIRVGR